jgi:flavin-dependent dehydrogenase
MESRDAVVVGGGPAGSSCARALARAGLDVLVLDRKAFPRDKLCAGWVTPQVFGSLEIDPEAYAKDHVLQPIHGFRVRRIGDREACADFGEVVSYGVRRCEFDDFLLRRSGAALCLGEPLRSLVRTPAGWLVNERIETPLVVGAGGHFCPVARKLGGGADEAAEPIVAAQEVEFELKGDAERQCRVSPELPELYFTPDLRGYGWLFRKGRYLNVGLGRQDRHRLGDHVDAFLRFLVEEGRIPAAPPGLRGHAYLLHDESPRPVVADGALLVGDACGLAYPRSGEGIRPAIESGLLAARAIGTADGRYDGASLAPYRTMLEARFGRREPRIRKGPTDLLPAALARRLAGRLIASPAFARHVLVKRWFVHAEVPALAP